MMMAIQRYDGTRSPNAQPDSAATKALQDDAKAASAKVDSLFRGETLRGLLLTSYGFSVFGERAAQAALVAFLAAAVLAIASIAGLVHAFSKAGDEVTFEAPSGPLKVEVIRIER